MKTFWLGLETDPARAAFRGIEVGDVVLVYAHTPDSKDGFGELGFAWVKVICANRREAILEFGAQPHGHKHAGKPAARLAIDGIADTDNATWGRKTKLATVQTLSRSQAIARRTRRNEDNIIISR